MIALDRELRDQISRRASALFASPRPDFEGFAEWVLEHFEPRRCPARLALFSGGLEFCKKRVLHEGPHVFDSSVERKPA
jgi:hypothetical protein